MPDLKAFLDGGGEAGALIRARDWGQTPLGPIRSWPQSLRSALSICLRSPEAMAIFWGPDFRFLYNDAWSAFLGDDRHPWGLGRTAQDVMADIWPTLSGQFDRAYREGQAISMADTLLTRHLGGRSFDSYWSYSVLPIASEDGSIGGLLAQARETTPNVMRARRDRFLVDLGDAIRASKSVPDLLGRALEQLGEHLGAVRTGYGEIDPDLANFTIRRCWTRDGLADVCGRYPVGYFHRPGIAAMHAGEPIVIDDGEASGLLSEEARERWAAIGCRASMVVPVIGEGRYSAVLFVHDAAPRQWSEHEQGLVAAVADRLWQYVGRARAEEALRRSEERHRRIFEEASDIILTADLDQAITGCNPAGAAAIGLPREAILGRSISDFVSAEGFDQTSRMLRQKMEHGGTTRHEIDVRAASGRIMHWEVNSTLAHDDEGHVVGLHAIARDVTERRQAEERQRLLVNELNHRVKNTLALVQGLALQSFKDGRDPAEARTAFQQRLAALASAHDLLTRESWEGATLGELVVQAVGHLAPGGQRISAEGPAVTLGPKAAVSLVMALHELATNAAKYGALSAAAGRVAVAWSVDGDRLALVWREEGGPPVRAPERRGFGLRMIERALANDLAGAARVDFEEEGLVCRIEASLAEAGGRPAEEKAA